MVGSMNETGNPAPSGKRREDERGQGLVEYGLIVMLVGIFLILAVGALGGTTSGMFSAVSAVLH